MSFFATVAIVCTMATCNNYHVDQADNINDARINTNNVNNELDKAMQDEKAMDKFLIKYKIGETVFEIVSIDIETHDILEDEVP